MEKKVMLSLVAMASTPLAGHADANLANMVEDVADASQAGGGLSIEFGEDMLVSPEGAPITLPAIELVPGDYKLAATTTSGSVKLSVKIGGTQAVELPEDGTFTVEATGAVEIVVASADGTAFQVGALELTHEYDYNADATYLQNRLTAFVAKLADPYYTDKKYAPTLKKEGSEISGKINKLTDPDKDIRYGAYKEYELYNGVENCKLNQQITTLGKEVENAIAERRAHEAVAELKTALEGVKTEVLDKASDYAEGKYQADYDKIERSIGTYESGISFENAADKYTEEAVNAFVTETNASIDALRTNIDNANADDAAYNEVAGKIAEARKKHETVHAALMVLLPDTDPVYAALFKDAQAKLAEAMKKLQEANVANGTPGDHDFASEKKYENLKAVSEALDAFTATQEKYEALVKAYTDAKAKIKTELQDKLDAKKTALETAGLLSENQGKITEIQGEIDNLNAKVDEDCKAYAISGDYNTTLSAEIAPVQDLIAKLDEATSGDLANYNAWAEMDAEVTELKELLDTAKKDVDALVSEDKLYSAGETYTAIERNIQKKIADYKTGAYNAKDDGTAATYQSEQVEAGTFAEIEASINTYSADANAVLTHYNEVAKALTALNTALEELKKAVENTDVTCSATTTTVEGETYGERIKAIETAIEKFGEEKEAALEKTDDEHVTAMLALSSATLESLKTAANTLKEAYSDDEAGYNDQNAVDAAEALQAEANRLINTLKEDIRTSLEGLTPDAVGSKYTDLQSKLDALNEEVNGINSPCLTETPTSENAAEIMASLVEVAGSVEEIDTKLRGVKGEIEAAKENITTNNANKKDAEKLLNEIQQRMDEAKALYIPGTLLTDDDKVTPSDNPDNEKAFMQRWNKLSAKKTSIAGEINTSCEAETLSTEWTEREGGAFKEILDGMKATADSLYTQAEAEMANYKAHQELLKTYGGIAKLLADAKTALDKAIPSKEGNGYAHYLNLLNETYQGNATKISEDIAAAYQGYKAEAEKAGLETRINTLIDKINKVAAKAKANEDAYKEQVTKGEAVMGEWSAAYAKISAYDESSRKESLLSELSGYQARLVALNKTVEEDWGKGSSAINGALDTYNDISIAISELLKTQEEGYDEVIAEDNRARYNSFLLEIKSTQDKYIASVDTIAELTRTVDLEYKAKIEDIIAGSDSIYTYSNKIRTLKDEAKNSFNGTQPRDTWDLKEANKKQAKAYGTEIDNTRSDLIGKIYEEAQNLLNTKLPAAKDSLAAAEAELVAQNYSEEVRKAAFADVKTLIKNVEQEEGSAYQNQTKYVLAADDMLANLGKVTDMIAAGKQTAANAECTALLSAKNAQVVAERDTLADYIADGYLADSVLVNYNKVVAATVDSANAAAATAEDMYVALPGIRGFLDKFDKDNPYATRIKDAQNDEANKKAYAAMNDSIELVQAGLNALDAYARKYYIYNDVVSTIANLQNRIDALRKDVDALNTVGGLNEEEQASILATAKEITADVENAKKLIDLNESNALKKEILNLRNLNAEVNGNNEDAFNAMEGTIDGLEGSVSDLVTALLGGEEKQDELIGLEKEIAAKLTDLETAKDPAAVTKSLDRLNNALEPVETKYTSEKTTLNNCHEPVQAEFSNELADIKKRIDAVKERISTCETENTLLMYKGGIDNSIEKLAADLAALSADINAAEAPYVANDEAHARLTGEIEALQTRKNAVANTINGYRDEVKTNEAIQDELADIQERIKKAKESVEKDYLETKLNANSSVQGAKEISADIDKVEKNAANQEADLAITDLEAAFNKAKAIIDGNQYSSEAGQLLIEKCDTINNSIKNLRTYHSAAYKDGSVSSDINGNPFVDENGNPVDSREVDFISEAIPAINAKIAEIDEAIKALAKEAENQGFTPGDINRDGSVLVDDYNFLLNAVLGLSTIEESSVQFYAADINGDKRINIGDLTLIIKMINGTYDAPTQAKARRAAVASNDAISLSVEGEGTKQRIAINLQNSMAYSGCQMDIMLPAGITLVSESLGSRAAGYTLSSNDLDNGTHRIVLSSFDDVEIASGSDAIIYLDVEVAHSYSGEGIEVSDIMFTDAASRVHNLPGISGNEATGIGTVTVGEAIKSKVYSVSGRLMDGLKRGINIIRNSDGSTKKVIVK